MSSVSLPLQVQALVYNLPQNQWVSTINAKDNNGELLTASLATITQQKEYVQGALTLKGELVAVLQKRKESNTLSEKAKEVFEQLFPPLTFGVIPKDVIAKEILERFTEKRDIWNFYQVEKSTREKCFAPALHLIPELSSQILKKCDYVVPEKLQGHVGDVQELTIPMDQVPCSQLVQFLNIFTSLKKLTLTRCDDNHLFLLSLSGPFTTVERLELFGVKNNDTLTAACFDSLAKAFPKVKALFFNNISSPEERSHKTRQFAHLEELSFRNITGAVLRLDDFASELPKLRSLVGVRISDYMEAILTSNNVLERLELPLHRAIDGQKFPRLRFFITPGYFSDSLKKCPIEELRIDNYFSQNCRSLGVDFPSLKVLSVSHVDDQVIASLTACKYLRVLKFNKDVTYEIDQERYTLLKDSFPHLEKLSLGAMLHSDGYQNPFLCYPGLKTLSIKVYGGAHIVDDTITEDTRSSIEHLTVPFLTYEDLVLLGKSKKLRSLKVTSCSHWTEEYFKILGTIPTLEVLQLKNVPVTGKEFSHFGVSKTMKELHLSVCNNFTDEGLQAISKHLPALQRLTLTRLSSITGTGFKDFIHHHKLQEFSIKDCSDITAWGNDYIDQIKHSLHKEHPSADFTRLQNSVTAMGQLGYNMLRSLFGIPV